MQSSDRDHHTHAYAYTSTVVLIRHSIPQPQRVTSVRGWVTGPQHATACRSLMERRVANVEVEVRASRGTHQVNGELAYDPVLTM